MSVAVMASMARESLRDETARIVKAQKDFEQTITHLTPQRQTELLALRQIALESARKHRGRR